MRWYTFQTDRRKVESVCMGKCAWACTDTWELPSPFQHLRVTFQGRILSLAPSPKLTVIRKAAD